MGYTLSKTWLLVLMLVPVIITLVAIAAWQNWGGIGTALAGFGGPLGAGLVNIASMPMNFALAGTAQLAIVWGAIVLAMLGFAYWVWHWDIGYKLSRGTSASPVLNYDNTMKREPEEPERSPTANPA